MSPLRRRLIEDMQIRNLSGHTQRAYVEHVVRFARYFRRSPEHLGPIEIRTYLLHLTQERRLAASSIIVTGASPSRRGQNLTKCRTRHQLTARSASPKPRG